MAETRERLSPEERATRQRKLLTVGTYLYGPSWQQALSDRLAKVVEGGVPRVRINQWATGSKPLPAWMLPVLADVALSGAAELRRRAEVFNRIAAGEDVPPSLDEGTPPVQGEPDTSEEPTLESGPTATKVAPYDDGSDFDIDALVVKYADKRLPRPAPEPAPEPQELQWTSKFAEEARAGWRGRGL
ncbi:hypothetical protein [Methylobacterium dankookense]|jgi:hypothetical protein|uniref:Uncharacterized protein n=1 Tax=Methylobacterium dankookense TaxID=560405 RepID=A0A564G5Y5_9HYPH|nr:hypothetical protein [Methylobacterium dankookense]GJD59022.1 hypothetical protein IFDJLNFL_4948 [Methylobacterium dankookense]VUF15444.1 hypothetical protein MTDSW087_05184 [Methylobacterium dankookense]